MSEERVNSYKTLSAPAQGEYSEQRSKFISFAIPVESEEEALTHIEDIRKKYFDARHVCWAYRIGTYTYTERSNDDGEPSSTAGKPILGQIYSHDLTNVVVAVVRYFGGVKLGTGGLIVAYRTAAKEAIEAGEIVEITLYQHYHLKFPYDLINPVMLLLKSFDGQVDTNDADLNGYLWSISIPNRVADAFEEGAEKIYQLEWKQKEE